MGGVDELAGPDVLQVGRDATAQDHLAQPVGDHIVFQPDVVLAIERVVGDTPADPVEEVGQTGVERQRGAQAAQQLVAEPGHGTGPHVLEKVVQIDHVGRDALAAVVLIPVG